MLKYNSVNWHSNPTAILLLKILISNNLFNKFQGSKFETLTDDQVQDRFKMMEERAIALKKRTDEKKKKRQEKNEKKRLLFAEKRKKKEELQEQKRLKEEERRQGLK